MLNFFCYGAKIVFFLFWGPFALILDSRPLRDQWEDIKHIWKDHC